MSGRPAPVGQSRGGPSGRDAGLKPPLLLLCLQGAVVPHDPGGAGRQPAVQREHHLWAAGVSATTPGHPGTRKRGRQGWVLILRPRLSKEGPPGKMLLAGAPLGESHPYDVTRP